jgi:hypothetical protein
MASPRESPEGASVSRRQLLIDSLDVLASPAEVQLEHLRAFFGSWECGTVDELGLEYDDIAPAAGDMVDHGEITPSQSEAVTRLNQYLDSFSGQANAHLWSVDALFSAPEWEEVRRLAATCLRQLQES